MVIHGCLCRKWLSLQTKKEKRETKREKKERERENKKEEEEEEVNERQKEEWKLYVHAHFSLHFQDMIMTQGFQGSPSIKEPSCQCKRHGFSPWVGKIPGAEHGNPLQCSCLENPMDRGAWQATVHGVAQSQKQLKRLSTHTSPRSNNSEMTSS